MIPSSSLRLGNYVFSGAPGFPLPHAVSAILPEEVTLVNSFINRPVQIPVAALEPIALTISLLEMAGFTAGSSGSEYERRITEQAVLVANPFISGGYAVQLCCKGNWSGHKPRFVHELQNLYFSLTGEELELAL